MQTQWKAIETKYKGYRFRSRLEARYAVFFDAIGLRWQYELEGFDLGGVWYLPDFFIPDWNTYLEIKPDLPWKDVHFENGKPSPCIVLHEGGGNTHLTDTGKFLLATLRVPKGQQLMMACGSPGVPDLRLTKDSYTLHDGTIILHTFGPVEGKLEITLDTFATKGNGTDLTIWPHYWTKVTDESYAQAMFPTGHCIRTYVGSGRVYDHPVLKAAYRAARSARFEHGESPNVG
jgi:hypothetical protein